MTGAPPTFSIAGSTLERWRTNTVCGIPISGCRLSVWIERSLSRATLMARAELSENTPIFSNWRTTAVPKKVIE